MLIPEQEFLEWLRSIPVHQGIAKGFIRHFMPELVDLAFSTMPDRRAFNYIYRTYIDFS